MRPRDAASLIVVDQSHGEPRILMGRRRADAVFLPDTFVFPGGRVERGDATTPIASPLTAPLVDLLRQGPRAPSTQRCHGLAIAALRETFEETGYALCVDGIAAAATAGSWQGLMARGGRADLKHLQLIARAITPPGQPRRYDTRFFLAGAETIAGHCGTASDGELSEVGWFAIGAIAGLRLPGITRRIVEDLKRRLAGSQPPEIPFYSWRSGQLTRTPLCQNAGAP